MNHETTEYVGFWSRVGASIIDSILILILIGPLLTSIYGSDYWSAESFIQGTWDFILSWVFPALAIILFWLFRSATPGKAFIKAKIVDAETGEKPEISQWLLRYLGYYLATIPLGLGILWVAWDPKKQGWHDKLAGTVVVRSKPKSSIGPRNNQHT